MEKGEQGLHDLLDCSESFTSVRAWQRQKKTGSSKISTRNGDCLYIRMEQISWDEQCSGRLAQQIPKQMAVHHHPSICRSTDVLINEQQCSEKTISLKFFFFFFFFFFFGHTCSMRKFPGQGMNPCHSSNGGCHSDNARYLTHCATRKLLIQILVTHSNTTANFTILTKSNLYT